MIFLHKLKKILLLMCPVLCRNSCHGIISDFPADRKTIASSGLEELYFDRMQSLFQNNIQYFSLHYMLML